MTSPSTHRPTPATDGAPVVTDPEDVAGTAAALRLAVGRLFRHMRRESSGGHTLTQLGILATLDRQGPTTLGELAATEGVAKPTVTKAIADLTAEGLVEKVDDPTDRRVCFARLTAEGRADLDDIRSRREAWLAGRLAGLDPDDRATVLAALPVLESLTGEAP
jgi:DNA-binding MarR family transcriptional regulator